MMQVTKDVCKIEEEIQRLRDAIEEQQARHTTLEGLIRDYKRDSHGNGASGKSNGVRIASGAVNSDSDGDEPRSAAPRATSSRSATASRHFGSSYSTASTLTHQSGVSISQTVGGRSSTKPRPDSASATSRLSRK